MQGFNSPYLRHQRVSPSRKPISRIKLWDDPQGQRESSHIIKTFNAVSKFIFRAAVAAILIVFIAWILSLAGKARAYEIKPVLSRVAPIIASHTTPPVQVAKTSGFSPNSAMWADYPILKRVCSCESWGDPNKEPRENGNDGNLLRGYPNPNDVGACQIHTPVWGEKATQLGYDIYTLAGNVKMAKYILKVQGLQAWSASKSCWE